MSSGLRIERQEATLHAQEEHPQDKHNVISMSWEGDNLGLKKERKSAWLEEPGVGGGVGGAEKVIGNPVKPHKTFNFMITGSH
jgi:hypothetical protein